GVIFYDDDVYETSAIMRSPSGELCTQLSLHDAEYCGDVKMDYLSTNITSKLSETVRLLQKDGLIDPKLSLKEAYDLHLHPKAIDLTDNTIWDALKSNSVVSVFQFDSQVGAVGARRCEPRNIYEMTNTNALIRLMSDGGEPPIDRFVRMKSNMQNWYDEMDSFGLTQPEQKVLEEYYLRYSGTPATQETIMIALMDERIAGMSLRDVNKVRKTIAKKKMDEIPVLKEKIYAECTSPQMAEYIWKTLVEPSLGYAFSLIHSLAYSLVGIQTLVAATKWPAVYWNTANLIVDSGGSDADSNDVNYGKVAKSIGVFKRRGITVDLPDINLSGPIFVPVASDNRILYGLNAIAGVSPEFIQKFISQRPFASMDEFMEKMKPNKTQMLGLIKSGCFDSLIDRQEALRSFLGTTAGLKGKLTLANLNSLLEFDMIPDEFSIQKRALYFNSMLRAHQKYTVDKSVRYRIEGAYERFYGEVFDTGLLEFDTCAYIDHKLYEKQYKKLLEPLKKYIAENQSHMLENFNQHLLQSEVAKYSDGKGTQAEMEVASVGMFSADDHWLFDIDFQLYNISTFAKLPVEPLRSSSFTAKNGREVSLFKIDKIVGIVVHRVPEKGIVYILDKDGVVEVKMAKPLFAQYDKQISRIDETGKKTVVAKSMFARGNIILVQGYRDNDIFKAKKYANGLGHTVSQIEDIVDGRIVFKTAREDL
ncbi:MAG: hypothetical protein ACRCZZ_04175, partial [Phocaeicola sp.]